MKNMSVYHQSTAATWYRDGNNPFLKVSYNGQNRGGGSTRHIAFLTNDQEGRRILKSIKMIFGPVAIKYRCPIPGQPGYSFFGSLRKKNARVMSIFTR